MPRKGYDKDGLVRKAKAQASDQTTRQTWVFGGPGGSGSRHADGSPVDFDALVGWGFFANGVSLRLHADLAGKQWYKARFTSATWPNHYIIVSAPPGSPVLAGLEQLAEKVAQVLAGTLRPSPDNY